jgi:hypothetical protein
MSAVHGCPPIENVARDQAQRLKAWVIAPVTPLRACAFAAMAASASGARPGTINCRSFQRAVSHCLARGSLGPMPHNSRAAGHNPWRKTMRAASAGACVLTWAPIEALDGEPISGTQRGLRAPASCVF